MSASKAKGTRFETLIVNWLRERLGDDRIERRTLTGAKDRGDIAGVRTVGGGRVVVEVKNQARHSLAEWLDEAEVEAGNDDAAIAVVIFKRRGTTKPDHQYALLSTEHLARLLEGGVK